MEKKYHALLKVSGTKEGVDLAAFMDHWFEEEPAKKKVKLPASLAQNMFEVSYSLLLFFQFYCFSIN